VAELQGVPQNAKFSKTPCTLKLSGMGQFCLRYPGRFRINRGYYPYIRLYGLFTAKIRRKCVNTYRKKHTLTVIGVPKQAPVIAKKHISVFQNSGTAVFLLKWPCKKWCISIYWLIVFAKYTKYHFKQSKKTNILFKITNFEF